ncbi:MAG: CheR family methyltransferase [bacterium]
MTANTVEQWLSMVIGLDPQILDAHTLRNAVKRRIAVCGLACESDYLKRLIAAPDELLPLIELLIVPETWFFRDCEPFVFLGNYIRSTWMPAHPADQLQVLSIPCSSGEEPYSIAMTIQSAGLLPERYLIDAVDINPALLNKAEKGVYGPNSFRGGVPWHCERYFKPDGTGKIVSPDARTGVRFMQGNIMSLPEVVSAQTYDIIFCRNLLIYQHAEARAHIIATLDRLLNSGGLLFVGHAEMMSLVANHYEPVRHSGTFAYCKTKIGKCSAVPELKFTRNSSTDRGTAGCGRRNISPDENQMPQPTLPVQPADVTAPIHESSSKARIDLVRALADQGRLDDAAANCKDLLKENPQLAEAHFLMGLIQAAAGQVQAAEECLNRTLYLDANYYEALVHLSLLKAQCGDEAGAERLRRHAGRVRDNAQVPA